MKKIAVFLGSKSDTDQISKGLEILDEFGVEYDFKVISAHHGPEPLHKYECSLSTDTYAAVLHTNRSVYVMII
ncbi:MAG: hypothetical protein GF384_02885 [Elusimicrobia bacterium]|nr:hypothetical protein [Elusimicrobiota bacterium]